MRLTPTQRLKFRLFAEGITISPAARHRLDTLCGQRQLTPADYASTSGLILRLDGGIWVNAPVSDYNPNFVLTPRSLLDIASDTFVVRSDDIESAASIWLPPLYHGQQLSTGRPANHFVFTHGDRVRLSPIRGCAMRCRFCNVPYDDPYELKPLDSMIEALDMAFADPLQPARHVLISGGTPKKRDIPYLRRVYEMVLMAFPERRIDIMMVPLTGLFDLPKLKELGINELSINVELFSSDLARELMPQKSRHGLSSCLDFISEAVKALGPGRIRSMLMVGLEPMHQTLDGVRAIIQAGGVPVLSPFRPDPCTPLRDIAPLSANELEEVFIRASEIADAAGGQLGPSCPPCTHNTLTLTSAKETQIRELNIEPAMV